MVMYTFGKVSVIVACILAVIPLGPGTGRPVLADTIVVPNAFEMAEGGTPAPNATDPRRIMQVFDASQFAAFDAPILISELALRHASTQVGPGSVTDHNLRVFFSTTSRSAATLSPNFAENIGPDHTEVSFWESITFDSANLPGPGNTRQFDIVIPVETPFRYDPTAGNLLVEFQVGPPDTEGQGDFDLVAWDPSVNIVAAFGSPTADSGDLLGVGFVTQFNVQPIPEPSTVFLLGLGALAVGFLGRRCHRRKWLTQSNPSSFRASPYLIR